MDLVSFKGNGLVELDSQAFKEDSTFGLSFGTTESNGLMLLATNQGKEESNVGDFYSLALVKGRLVLIVSSSSDPGGKVRIESGNVYNDGLLHTVVVQRRGQK